MHSANKQFDVAKTFQGGEGFEEEDGSRKMCDFDTFYL